MGTISQRPQEATGKFVNPNKINTTSAPQVDPLAKKNFIDTEQSVGETIEQVH